MYKYTAGTARKYTHNTYDGSIFFLINLFSNIIRDDELYAKFGKRKATCRFTNAGGVFVVFVVSVVVVLTFHSNAI